MRIAILLVSALGIETAQAARNPQQSEFVAKTIKRMVQTSVMPYTSRKDLELFSLFVSFTERNDLEEELNLSQDWDSLVENLFAAFDPTKFDELTEIYQLQNDDLETRSQKNWLHRFLVNGAIEVADTMVELGLELDKVDLQGLLLYALQEVPPTSRNAKAHHWWSWLAVRGASVAEPQTIEQLFKYAALHNDVEMLRWMSNHLFPLSYSADKHAIFVSSLNAALPLALRTGSEEAAAWLFKHGADVSVLEETELLRTLMFSYLVDTGSISLPSAQYASKSGQQHLLNEMLSKIASDYGFNKTPKEYIRVMEYLTQLGAKLTPQELQNILQRQLSWGKGNFVKASWAVAQGADLNELDVNSILIDRIESIVPNNKMVFEPDDLEQLFAFLRIHGFDRSQLDIVQLLKKAEEKNIDHGYIEKLQNAVSEQEESESIPAAEIWQQLHTEIQMEGIERLYYNEQPDYDSVDLLLKHVAADYQGQNIVWLLLYIGKVRGMSTIEDTLVEFIRLLPPREASKRYNTKMDNLLASMGLTEEKTAIAQSLLNRIFNVEATAEKYPFPLSFVNWAIESGADINELDQHAILRAIIEHQMLKNSTDSTPTHWPNINDILYKLQQEGTFQLSSAKIRQRVLQEAEALGDAAYKTTAEQVMAMIGLLAHDAIMVNPAAE